MCKTTLFSNVFKEKKGNDAASIKKSDLSSEQSTPIKKHISGQFKVMSKNDIEEIRIPSYKYIIP